MYIDIHGHSSKKNSFFYGPEWGMHTNNYALSRELPRVMGDLTSFFRYFSCSFRIAKDKLGTARAIFSK